MDGRGGAKRGRRLHGNGLKRRWKATRGGGGGGGGVKSKGRGEGGRRTVRVVGEMWP